MLPLLSFTHLPFVESWSGEHMLYPERRATQVSWFHADATVLSDTFSAQSDSILSSVCARIWCMRLYGTPYHTLEHDCDHNLKECRLQWNTTNVMSVSVWFCRLAMHTSSLYPSKPDHWILIVASTLTDITFCCQKRGSLLVYNAFDGPWVFKPQGLVCQLTAECWCRVLPSRVNEIIGVSHVKAYMFDGDLLMSGANLSNDYFTIRQVSSSLAQLRSTSLNLGLSEICMQDCKAAAFKAAILFPTIAWQNCWGLSYRCTHACSSTADECL